MNALHKVLGCSLALVAGACTEDAYVIGALCAPSCAGSGGVGAGGSGASAGSGQAVGLALDLTGSGVERLPRQLFGVEPTHFLVADDATLTRWEARIGSGFDVVDPAGLEIGQPSPFADPGSVLAHADAVTFSAENAWADAGAGALALEAVFRGEPGAVLLLQRDGAAGLELFLDLDGRLNLRISSGTDETITTSQPLVADAWHHCLALFDTGESAAQILCNGQAGAATTVPTGFALAPVAAPATLGGDNAARLHWAELARWQAPGFGPRGAWTDQARERFARLVGTYAEGASEPLPLAEIRASGAYVDMTPSDAPDLRRLHPVGEHWPRIVCRPTGDSPRTCGLLVETASSQPVAADAFRLESWEASELTVTAASAPGPTGAATLFALTPSAQAAEHALEISVPFGDGPAVLSLFARPAALRLIRAEVVGVASATFDVAASTVTESAGALVTATEPWGDGLVRLSYSFDVGAGPGRLRLAILADGGAAVFTGDSGVAAYAGDVQLRFRSFSTPLPTFGAIQQTDHLVYPAGNGNLPSGPWFAFSAEIWLPAAPLVADGAVFNANFSARYDQQINLFVSPDGSLNFWGLQGDATHWQLSSIDSLTDGNLHSISASVGPDGATFGVDGRSTTEPAGQYDMTALDRVEIGTSTSSSGPLTGIVRRILIAPVSD